METWEAAALRFEMLGDVRYLLWAGALSVGEGVSPVSGVTGTSCTNPSQAFQPPAFRAGAPSQGRLLPSLSKGTADATELQVAPACLGLLV